MHYLNVYVSAESTSVAIASIGETWPEVHGTDTPPADDPATLIQVTSHQFSMYVVFTASGGGCTDISHSLVNTTVGSTTAEITDTHDAVSADSIMFHISTTTDIADADSTLDITTLDSPYSVNLSSLSPQTQYYYWFRISHDEGSTDCRDTSSMGTFTTLDATEPDEYSSFSVEYVLNLNPDSVLVIVGTVDSVDFTTYEIRWDSAGVPANRAAGYQMFSGSAVENDTSAYIISSISRDNLPGWFYFRVFVADEVPNWTTTGVIDSVYVPLYPSGSINYMSSFLMGLQRR